MMSKRLAAATLAFVFAAVFQAGAAGGSRDSGVRISLTAGYDHRFFPASPMPVSAVVQSTRAIAGRLTLSSAASGTSRPLPPTEIPVEVPAGGKKRFDFLVAGSETLNATISGSGGRRLASASTVVAPAREIMVGVLGNTPPALAAVHDSAGTPVKTVSVPPLWLELGSLALTPLHYLVLDSSTARTLSQEAVDAIRGWTIRGGRLVLTGSEPARWLPSLLRAEDEMGESPDAGKALGLGRVEVLPGSAGAATSGEKTWAAIIRPAGRFSPAPPDEHGGPYGNNLALGAAIIGPQSGAVSLGWLTSFLILYVVGAGPINYYVLKQIGRKELLWLTIPALAVLFSGAGYILAKTDRAGTILRQATVALATPDGSTGERIAVVSSDKGGSTRINMGTPHAGPANRLADGFLSGASPVQSVLPASEKGKGAELVLETSPFSPALAEGSPVSVRGSLDGTLSWNGSVFTGSITNRTPYPLEEIRVVVGAAETGVGSLAPGASAAIPPISLSPFQSSTGRIYSSFPQNTMSPAEVASSLYNSFDAMLGGHHPLGFPYIAGVTRGLQPDVGLNGRSLKARGPSLIASPLKINAPGPGRLPAEAGWLEPVKLDRAAWANTGLYSGSPGRSRLTQLSLRGFSDARFLWRLPAGVDPVRVTGAALKVDTGSPGSHSFQPPPAPALPGGSGSSASGSVIVPPVPVPVPPGSQAPGQAIAARVEVFDWLSGDWVGFDAPPGPSSHPLPLTALTGGEALIRITPGRFAAVELSALGLEVEIR